jgi:hypothetical protein
MVSCDGKENRDRPASAEQFARLPDGRMTIHQCVARIGCAWVTNRRTCCLILAPVAAMRGRGFCSFVEFEYWDIWEAIPVGVDNSAWESQDQQTSPHTPANRPS